MVIMVGILASGALMEQGVDGGVAPGRQSMETSMPKGGA